MSWDYSFEKRQNYNTRLLLDIVKQPNDEVKEDWCLALRRISR
jgi:hypothetical protein